MHLDEIITETAARAPERVAICCGGRRYTYGELEGRVDRMAWGLRNLGLVPGDRVAYQLHNHRIEAVVTLFAVLRAGLIVVPLGLRHGPSQVAYALNHGGVRAWIAEPEFIGRIGAEQRRGVEWVVCLGGPAPAGTIALEELPYAPARELPRGPLTEDAIGLLVYTSGTTSRPKAVAHTQLRQSYRVDLFIEELELTEEEVAVVAHEIGRPLVFLGQVLAMLRVGGRIVLPRVGDAGDFWREYREAGGATLVVATPGASSLLLGHPEARAAGHGTLRYWICGGDRVLPGLHAQAAEILKRPISEMCGMTEVGFYAMTLPRGEVRQGSVGRVMQGCQVRIVDERGGEVRTGEVGEILVRTPNTMLGYWNDTLGTFRAFMDRWIRSGDLGRMDAEGYLWYAGRAKLMISRGGFKVAPPMVEDAIREHAAIAEAVVVAQSDPVQGQVPFAFYEVRAGAADPGSAALRAWVAARLDPAAVPEAFVRLERWPLTAQGKMDRSRLTLLAEAGGELQ